MNDLQALPLVDQDRLLLLHGSRQQQVPRVCPWTHVGRGVLRAKGKAVDGAFAILGLARVEG
jgi:hypothetical protein